MSGELSGATIGHSKVTGLDEHVKELIPTPEDIPLSKLIEEIRTIYGALNELAGDDFTDEQRVKLLASWTAHNREYSREYRWFSCNRKYSSWASVGRT